MLVIIGYNIHELFIIYLNEIYRINLVNNN